MPSGYKQFDRSRLRLLPLSDRVNDLSLSHWMQLGDAPPAFHHPDLELIARRLCSATEVKASRILMMGAHLLRAGTNRHIIDLLQKGHLSHLAMNGAGIIHDYE